MAAQFLLDQILATSPTSAFDRAYLRILLKLRRLAIRILRDPSVTYCIGDAKISLPLSHDLPLFRHMYPQYSSNVVRLAAAIEAKYPDLAVIDIGANVGDTFFLLRQVTDCPVLCIDGDEKFFRYLSENCAGRADAVLLKTFVGDKSGTVRGHLTAEGGTGRIAEDESSATAIDIDRLSNIVAKHPEFANCRLVKLDTDGYDCRIIRNELDLIRTVKPVLFFEYDPHFFEQAGDDGFAVFEALRRIGYRQLLCYDNLGDFMVAPALSDGNVIEDIHQYFRNRSNQRYLDICAFHERDTDLAMTFRRDELRYFEAFRSKPSV